MTLTIKQRDLIDSQIDEMFKWLDFTECVEQINDRFPDFEAIGYGISYLILKANLEKPIILFDESHEFKKNAHTKCITSDKPNGVRN